jgi:hypothetical protein
MFEEAGALDAAKEVRQELERVALLTQTILSPLEYGGDAPPEPALEGSTALFDIPSFLDAAVSLILQRPASLLNPNKADDLDRLGTNSSLHLICTCLNDLPFLAIIGGGPSLTSNVRYL